VQGALYPFLRKGAVSKDDVTFTVNDFMAMMGRTHRVGLNDGLASRAKSYALRFLRRLRES